MLVARVKLIERSDAVDKLRVNMLLGDDEIEEAALSEGAEQHLILALSLLEQARCHLKLAALEQDQ